MLVSAAVQLIMAILSGILNTIPMVLMHIGRLVLKIAGQFYNADWEKVGGDLVEGFKQGISNAWVGLKKCFDGLLDGLIGSAKSILGIASPSKVFKKLGSFTADGFGIGFEDEFAKVKTDMEDAMDFEDANFGISSSISRAGADSFGGSFGGTKIDQVVINVEGAKYEDERSLAQAIAIELQRMTERTSAAYG
jgi:hypothetical protein